MENKKKGSLKRHMNNQNKERSRDFKCELCDKEFYEKGDLKNKNEHVMKQKYFIAMNINMSQKFSDY